MALTLTADTNPGTASWTASSHLVAAAGVVTFGNAVDNATVTVPAGLTTAPILLSYQNDPNTYGISGGQTFATISGTTLTIQLDTTTSSAGLKVSYAVLSAI